jgi:hypothetical protein
MTTESTQPQSDLEPSSAAGPGQSQGHRRRRRRRKNKSAPTGATQAQQPQQTAAPLPQPVPQSAPPAVQATSQARKPRPAAPRQGDQQQGRKKKQKTFQKSSAPAASPGNNFVTPTQGKRRSTGGGGSSRQKGPREFVGPMDHSYRIANGNIADGPPSTVQLGGNGRGVNYQDDFTPSPTIAVREGTVTRIFCFIEDLFFMAKIQETARKLGVKVEFVKGDKEVLARLTAMPEGERPALLVFDLNNVNAKPMTLIPKLKTKLKKATSIVGFLSHLQGDLKLKAIEAGCDTVMPRSAFSQTLPNLLRRYGLEEEEDNYPQPV